MKLYPLPTGAFINLLEISEITPLPGAVSEESNTIHSPRCVVRLNNGSAHVIETESFDEAKAMAANIANLCTGAALDQYFQGGGLPESGPRTNLSLRDEP